MSNNPKKFGEDCEKFRIKSTLPDGRSFFNLETFKGENIGNSIYNVPSGHYFFMGDNRDNSLDSRIGQVQGGVGFVPYENLVGRADRVMFHQLVVPCCFSGHGEAIDFSRQFSEKI